MVPLGPDPPVLVVSCRAGADRRRNPRHCRRPPYSGWSAPRRARRRPPRTGLLELPVVAVRHSVMEETRSRERSHSSAAANLTEW